MKTIFAVIEIQDTEAVLILKNCASFTNKIDVQISTKYCPGIGNAIRWEEGANGDDLYLRFYCNPSDAPTVTGESIILNAQITLGITPLNTISIANGVPYTLEVF